MEQKQIDRINELAKKAKSPEGLTEWEEMERAALRREYIDSVLGNLKGQLDNTYIVDEKGNKIKLEKGREVIWESCQIWNRSGYLKFLRRCAPFPTAPPIQRPSATGAWHSAKSWVWNIIRTRPTT